MQSMNFVLFLNMLLYIFTASYIWKRNGMSAYSFLWLYYAVFASMGFLIVFLGIYDDRFYSMAYNSKFQLFPYICNYICIYLILRPFQYLKARSPKLGLFIKIKKKKINRLVNVLCIFFSIYMLLKLGILNEYSKYSLLERREMSIAGESIVSREDNYILWLVFYGYELLHTAVFPFLIIFVFEFYEKRILSIRKSILVVILYFLPPFVSYMMTSNRSGLFWLFMNATFYFFFFYKVMSKRLKKIVLRTSFLSLLPVALMLTLITQVRYEYSKTSVETGVLSYFGESFPNLGAYVYDQVGHHTYGMRLFPDYIKAITGISLKTDGGLQGYHKFWENYTGVKILVFKTLFGDLYIEFGTFGSITFVFIISMLFTIYIKKSKHIYTVLAIASFYYAFCLNAVLDYGLVYGRMFVPRLIIIMLCFGFLWRKYTGIEDSLVHYRNDKQLRIIKFYIIKYLYVAMKAKSMKIASNKSQI